MKTLITTAAVALAIVAGMAGPAQAKGCIKGAIVGGVAGHMANHGMIGAAGGCAVGHHMASKQEKLDEQQHAGAYQQQTPYNSGATPSESR
jgi:hypothetical protein